MLMESFDTGTPSERDAKIARHTIEALSANGKKPLALELSDGKHHLALPKAATQLLVNVLSRMA